MIEICFLLVISFIGTRYALPHSIRKLESAGYVAKDMYKIDKPQIPTNVGIVILFISYISICILPFASRVFNRFFNSEFYFSGLSETHTALLLVVSVYSFYGLVDDLVDIGRLLKVLLPILFSIPLIEVVNPENLILPYFGEYNLSTTLYADFKWSDIFKILIIPIYIMVVSNLVNMHSGYNGLQTGLTIILLTTLVLKSIFEGEIKSIVPVGAFLGSLIAFWRYNFYPARAFEGNIGSLLSGSVIGGVIVVQQYWFFGFFILMPHTFNFILWIIWLVNMRRYPNVHLNTEGHHTKFGSLSSNGTIQVPNNLTLKWIPNYYFELSEKQSTVISYFITLSFCIIGLIFL